MTRGGSWTGWWTRQGWGVRLFDERFHQTLKKWLSKQPSAGTIEDLQTQLDTYRDIYNNQRPHRSLPNRATPATIYKTRPKATPVQGFPMSRDITGWRRWGDFNPAYTATVDRVIQGRMIDEGWFCQW